MAETATPHDAIFKTFLSRVETARDFIELHLPPSLTQICKLDTLRLESGSFLEDDLRPYYSDILYSLETTRGSGYVHVLIEHQSAPDKLMAFRLMRYAIAAMQRHRRAAIKRCLWLSLFSSIRDDAAPIHGRCAGWIILPILRPPASCIAGRFRWSISR